MSLINCYYDSATGSSYDLAGSLHWDDSWRLLIFSISFCTVINIKNGEVNHRNL